jgi:hypothetical protein
MAQNSYPHSDSPLGEAEWRILAREFSATAVIDGVGGELACSADGSALATAVAAGRAAVEGFLFVLDAATTVAHTAADVTNDRIDVVVVEYDPDGSGTVGQGTARLTIVAGTPDASPVVPTLTQAVAGLWQFPLAEVLVTAASAIITAPDVTDVRVFGGSVRDLSGTTAERGAYVAESGQFWWDTDTVELYRWDGSAWQPMTPAIPEPDVQTFDTSDTWTKPAGAVRHVVELWAGGGGGGGTSNATNKWGGSGAGGGCYRIREYAAGDLDATEAFTIGAGGAGGADNSYGAGGGTTTFKDFAAYGGGGGAYSLGEDSNDCANGGGGGGFHEAGSLGSRASNGGTPANGGDPDGAYGGGNGGAGNGSPTVFGGGGGGGAIGAIANGGKSEYGGGGGGHGGGTAGSATHSSGGISAYGGTGGAGGGSAGGGQDGVDGAVPGGGGGGAYNDGGVLTGGDGGGGRCKVTTYFESL